jgi:hypothetical protein
MIHLLTAAPRTICLHVSSVRFWSSSLIPQRLERWGVEAGDVIATDLPNVAEGVLLQLACSKIGVGVPTSILSFQVQQRTSAVGE